MHIRTWNQTKIEDKDTESNFLFLWHDMESSEVQDINTLGYRYIFQQ
jgi:hypothetical protein